MYIHALKKKKFQKHLMRGMHALLISALAAASVFSGWTFDVPHARAAETKYASSHITGAFSNPTNAVGSTTGTWAGDLNTNSDYTSRWAMEDPSGAISGQQTINVMARKGSNSGDPSIEVNLYENGSLVQNLGSYSVTSTLGQSAGLFFDASVITNPNDVEIEVVETGAAGSPSARNSAQIDYIRWTANLLTPTTTLGDGTDPSNSTIAPGQSVTDLDQFTLQTNTGSDTVTALTVTLAPTGAFNNILKVEITNTSDVDQCTDIDNPASLTLNFTGCSLSVGTGATTYKVRVTPKAHADMAPPSSGVSYAVTGTVTDWTGTNTTHAGSDTDSATKTIDNLSPANVTGTTVSAGEGQNSLSWTNPGDSDFSQIVVLRRASSSVADIPVEGSFYSVENTVGDSIVACVTSSTSCTDTGLINETAYHYKIFAHDVRGNYSDGGVVPTGSPATPVAVSFNQAAYRHFASTTPGAVLDGGPTKIDDASDFGALPWTGRQVVRTSTGVLYAVIEDATDLEVWKSNDGSSWSEQNSANKPLAGAAVSPLSVVIDSSDLIHIAYAIGQTSITYETYNTSTDTWSQLIENVITAQGSGNPDITIDSNDIPHIIASYNEEVGPSDYDSKISYSNRIGGTWKTPVVIETNATNLDLLSNPSITINEDNIPEISYINVADADLTAGVGNQNDATSFTLHDVDTSVNTTSEQRETSIAVDSSGNTWVAYIDATTQYVTLVKHNDADAWTTWQTPITNSNVGSEPSLAIDGTDVYVFYENDTDDIAYDKYGGTWAGETTLQSGTFQDVTAKWSYLNNNEGSTQIDYLYSDGTDVYWASLGLSAPSIGEPLAVQDTAASLTESGQAFRLRMLLAVTGSPADASEKNFKLQYAQKSDTCDVSFTGEQYYDVSATTTIAYYDDSAFTDGSTAAATTTDPAYLGHTVVYQEYVESTPFTNSVAAIPVGQDGLWDISLYNNGGTGGTAFCLRVVDENETQLDSYTVIPEITTAADVASVSQLHYRWRNDKYTEGSTAFLEDEDTALNSEELLAGDRVRLRMTLSNSSVTAATEYTYQLEYASGACSAWSAVPNVGLAAGGPWEMGLSTKITNESSTTNNASLTDPDGLTFIPGIGKSGSNTTSAYTLGASEFTELEWVLLSTSDVATDTTYCFRVTNNGSTATISYDKTPSLTLPANVVRRQSGGSTNSIESPAPPSAPQTGGNEGGGEGGGEGSGGGSQEGGGGPGGGGGGDLGYIHRALASVFNSLKHLLLYLR